MKTNPTSGGRRPSRRAAFFSTSKEQNLAKPVRKIDANGKTAADRAREHLSGGAKPKIVVELASERDAQHWIGKLKAAEKSKKKAYAEADEIRSDAKTSLDKIYADAADALKSRGVSKRLLKERVDEEARKDDEVTREYQAKIWLGRATQSPWAQQTFQFEGEPVRDANDAKKRARQAGYDASAEGRSSIENPFNANQELSQEFLGGYHEHQAEKVRGMGAKKAPVEGSEAVN